MALRDYTFDELKEDLESAGIGSREDVQMFLTRAGLQLRVIALQAAQDMVRHRVSETKEQADAELQEIGEQIAAAQDQLRQTVPSNGE